MNIRRVIKNGRVRWLADVIFKGSRERHYHKSKGAAQKFLKKRKKQVELEGIHAFDLSIEKRREWAALDARLERHGLTPAHAVEIAIAHHKKTESKTLNDAMTECIAAKKAAGKRKTYTRKLDCHIRSFIAGRTDLQCSAVTRQMVEVWSKVSSGKTPVSLYTVRARLIDIGTFFSFCLKRGWCASNPCEHIERVMVEERPPGIHSISDAQKLLKACLEHPEGKEVLPYVALGYFAGLRPAEALKLKAADIGEKLIDISGVTSKTRRRRFIEINETLKAWLAETDKKPRPLNFFRKFERVRKSAGVPWPHDVLRHSFCSYALPVYGASKTAEWAGHSETILFAHYRERVKPDDANKFWSLSPSSVLID